MSVNDRNDWDDGLDFESLADEQLESSQAQEPAYEEPSYEEPAPESVDDEFEEPVAEEEEEAAPERPQHKRPRRPRVSGTGLGLLFAFSIIVAAVGIGGALVLALGVDPLSLWQPESFRQVDQFLNLDQNPVNLVYIVTLATLLLTLLGGWGIARSVRRVGEQAARDAELLERVAALRIDDERGWQDNLFRDHPQLSVFVTENLGTWRMQEIRQKRATGLEGELQRLAKAAAADERERITDRYDHPAVGSLADEIVRYYDERDSARREAEANRAKDREESNSLLKAITEAAGWNLGFTDRIGVQGAAAAGIASRLRDLVTELDRGSGDDGRRAIAEAAALRREVQSFGRDESPADAPDLIALADRGNKLAFQIAMEVARLGTRGERLLPMTQALEELTTDVRKSAESLTGPAENTELESFRERCHGLLTSLEQHLEAVSTGSGKAWAEGVEAALPAATQLATQLGSFAEQGTDQTRRLHELGSSCAALTGLEYDADQVAPLEIAPTRQEDEGFTRFDPFSTGEEAADADEGPLAADPFESGQTDSVLPSEGVLSPAAEPEYDPWGDPAPVAESAPEPAATIEPEPAGLDEGVIDLTAYGAEKVEEPVVDDVIDLSAYGAVRIDDEPTPVADEVAEEVHELAEFGAVRID